MNEPTLEEIKKALSSANEDQLDFVLQLDEFKNSDSVAVKAADAYQITYNEMIIINEWLKYIFLGLKPVTVGFDCILAATNSEEESIFAYMMQVVDNTPKSLREYVKKIPFNKDVEVEIPGFFDGTSDNITEAQIINNTNQILSNLAQTSNQTDSQISKDDILAGIENPTETVKTPSFALPKSKPQTTKILSSLAQPTDPTKAIIDPLAIIGNQSSVEDVSVENIVDPFMSTVGNGFQGIISSDTSSKTLTQSASIPNPEPISTAIKTPVSPAQKIIQNMDEKLQKVQGTTPTEVYKVAETPRHDPYREVPGL